ncbi:MAG: response regulator [Deltaproteobacteria bacterium]|nr:response regulator [Deltaproteobacteria bacterium]
MPKKILLADDSVTIQKVVSLILASDEYELISVSDGESAIAKINEIKPDLIMADVVMPNKNGYEVCDFVKKTPALRHIPVMLLAGTFEPLNEEEAKRVGIDDSIVKPFESQEFINKVNSLLSRAVQEASVEPAISAPASDEAFELGDFLGIEEEEKPAPIKEPEIVLEPAIEFTEEGFLGEPSKQEPVKEPEKTIEIGIPEMPEKEEKTLEIGLELGSGFGEEIKPEEPVKKEEPLELGVEEVEEIHPLEVVEPLEEIIEEAEPLIEPTMQPPTMGFPEPEVSMPEIKMPAPAIFEERIEEKAKEAVAEEFKGFEAIPKEKLEQVIAKISKKVIEEVAWEVIPDVVERVMRQEMEKIKEAILKTVKG